jgi:hypothetical protein
MPRIAEVKRGTVELTEVQKLDNEILKQKYTPEILAFLELDIAKRRELAQAIDEATKKQHKKHLTDSLARHSKLASSQWVSWEQT